MQERPSSPPAACVSESPALLDRKRAVGYLARYARGGSAFIPTPRTLYADCMRKQYADSEAVSFCKLCGEVADLRKSHIIPEFAYGPSYDENHKLVAFDPVLIEKRWKVQKGFRERLLCGKCEQFLNRSYEAWFKGYWFDSNPLAALDRRDHAILKVPEPARFKLFHLSILLRADLASHSYWSEVNLGAKHRARIADMVRNEDPGEPHEYPIVCCAIQTSANNPAIWWELVSSPNPGRTFGVRLYQFTFGGCGWMYYVSSHRKPDLELIALKQDGHLPVVKREWMAFKRYRSQ